MQQVDAITRMGRETCRQEYSGVKKAFLTIIVILLLVAGFFGYNAKGRLDARSEMKALAAGGKVAKAQVTNMLHRKQLYVVTYSFTPEGATAPISSTHGINESRVSWKEGDTVEVVYLPSNPRASNLKAIVDDPPALGITLEIGIMSAALVIIILLLLALSSERKRLLKLAVVGLTTRGIIKSRDAIQREKSTTYKLTYGYAPRTGKEVTRTDRVDQATFNKATVGSPIVVFYDPGSPNSAILLPKADPAQLPK